MGDFQWRFRNPFYIEFFDDEIDPEDINPFHSSEGIPIVTILEDEDQETRRPDGNRYDSDVHMQEIHTTDGLIDEQTDRTERNIITEMRNNVNTL